MEHSFWKDLPSYKDFNCAFDVHAYTAFCPSWHLFIADIQGSTQAIREGRYKDVNFVGAMSIVAVINACEDIDIPFIFGGDGASILVPDSCAELTRDALIATKAKALNQFDLQLRIGHISVQELNNKNIHLLVAKHEISKDYQQAIFYGGGMSKADKLIKNDASYCYDLPNDIPDVDFSGLECRWQDIPSPKEETISLLVAADDPLQYRALLDFIGHNFGDYTQRNPVQDSTLNLSFSLMQLAQEAALHADGIKKHRTLLSLWLVNLLGWLFMRFNITIGDTQWGDYKQQVILTTDSEKFDDILRMTFATNTGERQQLEHYLKQKHHEGKLCYGMHITNRALMTCLVFERMGSQVHFVDAADGGYAMAAVGLKQQLKNNHTNKFTSM